MAGEQEGGMGGGLRRTWWFGRLRETLQGERTDSVTTTETKRMRQGGGRWRKKYERVLRSGGGRGGGGGGIGKDEILKRLLISRIDRVFESRVVSHRYFGFKQFFRHLHNSP